MVLPLLGDVSQSLICMYLTKDISFTPSLMSSRSEARWGICGYILAIHLLQNQRSDP
jgi:hypothetical protein